MRSLAALATTPPNGYDRSSVRPYPPEHLSRYVLLHHLSEGDSAEAVNATMADAIGRVPAELARTHTWDQGTEMSKHLDVTNHPRCPPGVCARWLTTGRYVRARTLRWPVSVP